LFKRIKFMVGKDKQALIQNDFLGFFTSGIQDKAGPVASRNGCGESYTGRLSRLLANLHAALSLQRRV
jgi:hypothetical protein